MANARAFVAELGEFEHAWDLDFRKTDVEADIETLAENEATGDFYEEDGGVDDGMSVGDEWSPLLACSLYSILAIKPGWLGANSPQTLHRILRKTLNLKDYDDNKTAATIRKLAGFTPTVKGGVQSVNNYLASLDNLKSMILDVDTHAHTFALIWDNDRFKRTDETGSNREIGEYATDKVITVWQL